MALILNNPAARVSADMLNKTQEAVKNIRLFLSYPTVDNFTIAGSASWTMGGETATFHLACCPDAVKFTDIVRGLRRNLANTYSDDDLIIEGEVPYTITVLGDCGGLDKDDGESVIENQGIFHDSSGQPGDFWIGTAFNQNEGEAGYPAAETHLKCICQKFVLPEIEGMPVGSTISNATMLFRTTNLVKYEHFIETYQDGGEIHITDYGWESNNIDGEISFMLLGIDKDNEIDVISGCASTVETNNIGEWVEISITDLIQNYLDRAQGAKYTKIVILATPYPLNVEEIKNGKKLFLQELMKSSWLVTGATNYDLGGCNIGCYYEENYSSYLRMDNIEIGSVEITFDLPDLSQYGAPYCNIPGFADL